MPNVLAHNYAIHEVMRDSPPAPDMALGSTLPDFAGMYRDREGEEVTYKKAALYLDTGIYFHRLTDKHFNTQPEIPQITTRLAQHLEHAGIEPGTARVSAHFLADIMLDGALVSEHEPRDDFDELKDLILSRQTSLHKVNFPADFIALIENYFINNTPWMYADPEKLARITQRRLGQRAVNGRSKKCHIISRHLLPVLTEVIDTQSERVHRLGRQALTRTIKILDNGLPPATPDP